jgi:Beta-lactamase class C and other penicillin binding proteins
MDARFKLLGIVFFILVQVHVFAQRSADSFSEGSPAVVGVSEKRLQLVDQLIQEYVNKGDIPGGVFFAARDNQVIYNKTFGFKTPDKKTPYKKDDIFRICSMTKAVTTVAIMQLYENGKLGLDDAVKDYIPAFEKTQVLDTFNEKDSSYTTVPIKSPLTIRHLLTHTSGIAYGDFYPGKIQAVYKKNKMLGVGLSHPSWTTEEFINRLAAVPLVFQPGDHFMYGLNMDVLGRIVEVVSGEKLADYFRKHIFEPLGMKDTYFYLPKEKQTRLVPIYSYDANNKLDLLNNDPLVYNPDYPKSNDIGHYAGGGGLSSTSMDYAIFIQALLNNGIYKGERILSRKTIEVMTADQMIALNQQGKGISNKPGDTFCLGFELRTEPGKGINSKSPGTYEWGGYFTTKFFIDPKEDLIFVGMMQIHNFKHGEFWDRLTAILYSSIQE